MDRGSFRPRLAVAVALLALLPSAVAGMLARDDFEGEPISYSDAQPKDAISRLQERVNRGETVLQRSRHGYLSAVLRELGIPVSSQTLVFSKTSFQRDHISPTAPRALYFNREVYVGWVQGGSVLEFSTVDPQLGAVFYTLDQYAPGPPRFVRQTQECLSCHASTLTRGIPGHIIRSVIPARDGQPILTAGSKLTTDQSPFEERWGGWYVTGTHGKQRHRGNLIVGNAAEADDPNLEQGANITDLRKWCSTTPYLSAHSDIVALMVMEHQMHVQNLITAANHGTRRALHFEMLLNRDLGRQPDYRSDSTQSRISSSCEPLVRALLLSGEARLTDAVAGTTSYAREFPKAGPRDAAGRSLRDLDLKRRLFRYPCSYLIYSEAFNSLPREALDYVYRRLNEVLSGKDTSEHFTHLTAEDRTAIREILRETKPECGL